MSNRYQTVTVAGDVVEHNGKPVEFLRRTFRQRIALEESAAAWAKQQRADNLRLAGIDPQQIIETLADMDERRESAWIDYVNTLTGKAHVLDLALAENDDRDEIAEQLFADGRALAVVCELWGLEPKAEAEPVPLARTPEPVTFDPPAKSGAPSSAAPTATA